MVSLEVVIFEIVMKLCSATYFLHAMISSLYMDEPAIAPAHADYILG